MCGRRAVTSRYASLPTQNRRDSRCPNTDCATNPLHYISTCTSTPPSNAHLMTSAPSVSLPLDSQSPLHPEQSDEMAFVAPFPLLPRRLRPNTTAKPPYVLPVAVAEPHIPPGPDYHGIPNPPPGTRLLLSDLRERLIRQEETIIFSLIERAQFRRNARIYKPGMLDVPHPYDFSQYLLYELEKVYATVRRYTSPDEHPFAPQHILPNPILPSLQYPGTLKPNTVNVNDAIQSMYREKILPGICHDGDDQNYGSAATCDVACLQALSKRIHYGKFIAEAKCQEQEQLYAAMAGKNDRSAIWNALSNFDVEQVLLKRVENKATSYGSDITFEGARAVFKVNPRAIANIYRDFIIPLTKQVEVDYILQRYSAS